MLKAHIGRFMATARPSSVTWIMPDCEEDSSTIREKCSARHDVTLYDVDDVQLEYCAQEYN